MNRQGDGSNSKAKGRGRGSNRRGSRGGKTPPRSDHRRNGQSQMNGDARSAVSAGAESEALMAQQQQPQVAGDGHDSHSSAAQAPVTPVSETQVQSPSPVKSGAAFAGNETPTDGLSGGKRVPADIPRTHSAPPTLAEQQAAAKQTASPTGQGFTPKQPVGQQQPQTPPSMYPGQVPAFKPSPNAQVPSYGVQPGFVPQYPYGYVPPMPGYGRYYGNYPYVYPGQGGMVQPVMRGMPTPMAGVPNTSPTPRTGATPASSGGATISAPRAAKRSCAIKIIDPTTREEIVGPKAVPKAEETSPTPSPAKSGTVVLSSPGEATSVVPPVSRKTTIKKPDGTAVSLADSGEIKAPESAKPNQPESAKPDSAKPDQEPPKPVEEEKDSDTKPTDEKPKEEDKEAGKPEQPKEDDKGVAEKKEKENEASKENEADKKSDDAKPAEPQEEEDEEEDSWETRDEAELTNIQKNKASDPVLEQMGLSANKLMYDRNFLLKFQKKCTEKPENLPSIDVILSYDSDGKVINPPPHRGRGGDRRGGGGDWKSRGGNYKNDRRSSGGGRRGGGRDRKGGRNKGGGGVTPSGPAPTLTVSENAWKRPEAAKEKSEQIERQTTGLLNKITLEKFLQISDRFLELQITDAELLCIVIKLVFDKAVSEPHFAAMYAKLCNKLDTKFPQFESEGGQVQTFKRLLLNRCQEEFEKKMDKSGWDELSEEEQQMLDFRSRKRMLGNIKFIGELYKGKMLSEKIMHSCICHLLRDVNDPEPEDIEAVCKLMDTIGMSLDKERASGYMDGYFARLHTLRQNKKLELRVRFLIQDVLDLRANRWTPRREKEGPKTIKDVHKEAQMEDLQAQRQSARMVLSNKGGRGRMKGDRDRRDSREHREYRGNNRPSNNINQDPTGWAVAGSKNSRVPKQEKGERVLGPRGGSMGSGAKGWSDKREQKSNDKKSSGGGGGMNRFSMLLGDNASPERKSRDDDELNSSADSQSSDMAEAAAAKPTLSIEKLENETTATLREFYELDDLDEAYECINDLHMPEDMVSHFVNFALMSTLESKAKEQKMVLDLILRLVSEDIVDSAAWQTGVSELLQDYEDLIIDIPRCPVIFGNWFARTLNAGLWRIEDLSDFIGHLVASGRAIHLAAELISSFKSLTSAEGTQDKFSESNFDILDFFPESKRSEEDLAKAIDRYAGLKVLYPLFGVKEKLVEMTESEATAEETLAWVSSSLSEEQQKSVKFLSMIAAAIVAQVVKRTVKETDPATEAEKKYQAIENKELKRWKPLLVKLFTDDALQLYYLLEVQRSCAENNFPKKLIERLFHLSYHNGIITEEAIEQWNEDDSDVPGKRDSLFQLNKWLDWLKNADSESEDEEAGEEPDEGQADAE